MKKKSLITILCLMTVFSLMAGCKKDKQTDNSASEKQEAVSADLKNEENTDNKVEEETSEKEDTEEVVETVEENAVSNNGGHFVKVGSKVYFIKPGKDSIETTALWGEFINNNHTGKDNELMCYDTSKEEMAVRVGDAEGKGRMAYFDGRFYGQAIDNNENGYIFATDIKTGKSWKVADGWLTYVDSETGRYVVRLTDAEHNGFSVYEGGNRIGQIESDALASLGDAYLCGDILVLDVTEGMGDFCAEYLFVYNVKDDTHRILGNISNDEDSYGYNAVEQATVVDGTLYIYVATYEGSGSMFKEGAVYKADPDKEYSLKEVTRSEGLKVFPDAYAENEHDSRYDELLDISYGTGDRNIMEICEDIDGDSFAIVNKAHYNESESIGWRDAYTVDSINFYKIKDNKYTEITDPIEFSENKEVGLQISYRIENPNDWSYTDSGIDSKNFAKELILKEVERSPNEIIDEDRWFEENSIGRSFFTGKYRFEHQKSLNEDNSYIINLYDKETDALKYVLDLSEFYYPYKVVGDDPGLGAGWRADFRFGYEENDIAYISMAHRTYSETMMYHAYILAIDLNNGKLLWKSKPITCNSSNFAVICDVIVCGYGFTAEPDYIYQIDKKNGFILTQTMVKSKPEYIVYKEGEGRLYVRTYNTDYVYDVLKQ